jgi:hypothetical protein
MTEYPFHITPQDKGPSLLEGIGQAVEPGAQVGERYVGRALPLLYKANLDEFTGKGQRHRELFMVFHTHENLHRSS